MWCNLLSPRKLETVCKLLYEMQRRMVVNRKNTAKVWMIFFVLLWATILFFTLVKGMPIESIEYSLKKKVFNLNLPSDSSVKNETKNIETFKPYYNLSDQERQVVWNIVTGEAGNQPYEGKVAVANCILNACLKDNIQPTEVKTKYGYMGWKNIDKYADECMNAYGNTNLADEVYQAVEQVFDRGEILNSEMLWFYSGRYSKFHESQKFVMKIGEHRFFAPKN